MSRQTKLIIALVIAFASITVMSVLADTVYLPAVYKQPTPTATKTPIPLPDVEIVKIVNDVTSYPLDEYVEIKNYEEKLTVDMGTWIIKAETGELYEFPEDFELKAGNTVKIWTRNGTDTSSNLYWNYPTKIWIENGNCAYLKEVMENGSKIEIDTYCY